jgi:hypothetical protein
LVGAMPKTGWYRLPDAHAAVLQQPSHEQAKGAGSGSSSWNSRNGGGSARDRVHLAVGTDPARWV